MALIALDIDNALIFNISQQSASNCAFLATGGDNLIMFLA
jgi:hypothetical protein